MPSKLSALKALYTALGGTSDAAATLTSEISVWNAILALGEIEGKEFIPDAIAAVAENFVSIDPSPAVTLGTASVRLWIVTAFLIMSNRYDAAKNSLILLL